MNNSKMLQLKKYNQQTATVEVSPQHNEDDVLMKKQKSC